MVFVVALAEPPDVYVSVTALATVKDVESAAVTRTVVTLKEEGDDSV